MKKPYKLGTISIDADGNFWCDWMGTATAQGGPHFGPTSMGTDKAEELLRFVAEDLERCKDIYLEEIKKDKNK